MTSDSLHTEPPPPEQAANSAASRSAAQPPIHSLGCGHVSPEGIDEPRVQPS